MALAYGYQLYRHTPVTRAEVFVSGVPITSIAPKGAWGGLHTRTTLNGDGDISFNLIPVPGKQLQRHPLLVAGAPVTVQMASTAIGVGSLREPNWDSGEIRVKGAPSEGDSAVILDGSGQVNTAPNTAIDQAIARGAVGWTRRGNFGTTSLGADADTASQPYLTDLLNAWADANNSGWAVNTRRELIITGPPVVSSPRWFITPGSGMLGQADDDRIDRVFVRYISTASGNPYATATYPASTPQGGRERGVYVGGRGPISPATATATAQGIWSKMQGQSGWANGLELTAAQISTPGGLAADLTLIRAGDTARLLSVPDPRGLEHHTDVVLGETDLDHDAESILINPTGLAQRSLEDLLTKDYAKYGYTAL